MDIIHAESLMSKTDVTCSGAIVCEHGVFVGDLLLSSKDGDLCVHRLKQHIVPRSLALMDVNTVKTPDLSHTCAGWYTYALLKGYYCAAGAT